MKAQVRKNDRLLAGKPAGALRQRILEIARRQFFAHGFRGVTTDELAAELGISKKTLYACFRSKTELVRAVLVDKFRRVETDLDAVMAAHPGDASATLKALLACLRAHTDEIQPPLVRDLRRGASDLFALVERRRRQIIERYVGRVFEQGRQSGVIRKDLPTGLAIEILLAVTDSIMNPTKLAELGIAPKTGYVAIFTVLLEGLLTERGRAG